MAESKPAFGTAAGLAVGSAVAGAVAEPKVELESAGGGGGTASGVVTAAAAGASVDGVCPADAGSMNTTLTSAAAANAFPPTTNGL